MCVLNVFFGSLTCCQGKPGESSGAQLLGRHSLYKSWAQEPVCKRYHQVGLICGICGPDRMLLSLEMSANDANGSEMF